VVPSPGAGGGCSPRSTLPRRGSARLGATPAQVALASLIARPGTTAPIASATSLAQLDELAGAVRLRLDPAAIGELDAASR
jgi:aryl-alcohol dehydrogenase-like predicted oxidoreductase